MPTNWHQSTINNSTSKAEFSFPKSLRFETPKKTNQILTHINPNYFSSSKTESKGNGFNSSATRFFSIQTQSSNRIDGPPGSLDKWGNSFGRQTAFKFGVSRGNSSKIFIDKIIAQSIELRPGPGAHDTPYSYFGLKGRHYSMRPKDHFQTLKLEKQRKFPGPTNYYKDDGLLDITGRSSQNSKFQNNPKPSFSKSEDRFRLKQKGPDPTTYYPQDNFTQNVKSNYNFSGSTKFPKNKLTFIDHMWRPKQKASFPAPGHYNSFSDFSGLADEQNI